MSETTPPPDAEVECANCGRRFEGTYCPDCGQERRSFDRPFTRFVRDLLADVLAFDARIWRTLPLLVTNPGALARDYVSGLRARYVPPLRLYVFLGAAFFAVLALAGGGPFRFGVVPGSGGTVVESPIGVELATSSEAVAQGDPGALAIARAARDLEGINAIVIGTLSYVHFLLLPVLAAYLLALWRSRWYLEHLVFAAYLGAFGLLGALLAVGIYALAGNPDPPNPGADAAMRVWMAVLGIMAYRSIRAMYGDSRPRSVVKAAALLLGYVATAALATLGIVLATLYLVY